MKRVLTSMVGVAILATSLGGAARAAEEAESRESLTSAALLEKGIYTEETVGDVEAAIKIYQQVIDAAKADHLLAARAQYRIGQCLLKTGKKAEATAAFEKLIKDFPDAKELVAKAQKHVPSGLPLGPVPWVDGEVLQLNLRMPTGLDVGTMIYTVESAEFEGRKVWQVGSRTFVTLANMTGMSRVHADWDTFRPIQSTFKNSRLGDCSIKYSENLASVTVEGPNGKTIKKDYDLAHVVYDNEQAMHVIRRLPLAPDYKTTLPDMAELGIGPVDIGIEVLGKETVRVPAGEFECFKVLLMPVNQTFWFAIDPHRYLVKFAAGGVAAELTSIGQNKPGKLRLYEDEKLGFSFAMPNDWYFYAPTNPLDKKHLAMLNLLDPEAIATSYLFVDKAAGLEDEKGDILRTWANGGLDEARKIKKDFAVREDTWQPRTVSGSPALGVIADYTDVDKKMVEYSVYVAAKSSGLKLKFGLSAPADQFDTLRKVFDTIVDSLIVTPPPASAADQRAAENLAAEGWKLWNARKLAEAEEKFKKAVDADPRNANAWNGLGWAQQNQGKLLGAQDSFKTAVDLDPKAAASWNGLGWIAKAQGKPDDAIAYWKKAIEAAPGATAALNGLGTTYTELGRYDEAVDIYQKWLKVEPKNTQAQAGLKKAREGRTSK